MAVTVASEKQVPIQIASDLNLQSFESDSEEWRFLIRPAAPYLVLLGNLGQPGISQVLSNLLVILHQRGE